MPPAGSAARSCKTPAGADSPHSSLLPACRAAIRECQHHHQPELHARAAVRSWVQQHAHTLLWDEHSRAAYHQGPQPNTNLLGPGSVLDVRRWPDLPPKFRLDVLLALLQVRRARTETLHVFGNNRLLL
jgi:hypothetical protein